MRQIILFLSLLIWVLPGFGKVKIQKPKKQHPTVFAIIVDEMTLEKTKGAIEAYRDALENDGLATYIVSEAWKNPDQVRKEIVKLYKRNPTLEGVVFIGDIPIALIRNAQHMTTAFKMNEETFPFPDSSVPSDRFYDDLHLTFDFIRQDSVNPLHFYYKLREDSPQRLNPTFYSGRIKYPERKGGDKYEAIAAYLNKVVREKQKENVLDHFVSFTGNGYNSDCLIAWMDERLALTENFPMTWRNSRSATFLNYRMDDYMKYRLLDELQRDETDVMLFHEHGAPAQQYISPVPAPSGLKGYMNFIKSSIYSIVKQDVRKKKGTPEEIMAYFTQKYALGADFFNDFSLEDVTRKDSLEYAKTVIHLDDLKDRKTNPRFVMFDACYNGSFHEDGYIAGYYIFNDGNTMVTQGNTRNVLQDRWTIEMIGLLSQGVRIGQWNRLIASLEGHIIGDPTFHFSPASPNTLGTDIVIHKNDKEVWEQYLHSPYADVQALALRMLVENDKDKSMSPRLLTVFKASSFNCVRMEALKLLSRYANQEFAEAIQLGLYDAYELIRRNAAIYTGKCGNPCLVGSVIDVCLNYPESQRVRWILQGAIPLLPHEKVEEEIRLLMNKNPEEYPIRAEDIKGLYEQVKTEAGNNAQDLVLLQDIKSSPQKQISKIRYVRNYPRHENVKTYLSIIGNDQQPIEIRVNMAEALGWFNYSYRKNEIRQALADMLKNQSFPKEVELEIKQTINRLM